jgi:hypothetical protein
MCSASFEVELSKERDADSQEDVSTMPIAPITDTGSALCILLV